MNRFKHKKTGQIYKIVYTTQEYTTFQDKDLNDISLYTKDINKVLEVQK
jgi:hypothetical protein